MLEFEFPSNASGTWSVSVTGDLYKPMNLAYLGFSPQAGAQTSPITIGFAIGPPAVNPYTLTIVDALAEQAFYADPAFVATAEVPVPKFGGAKSLYVVYHFAVDNNIPYSALIYKVTATPPVSIRSRPGPKRGHFS